MDEIHIFERCTLDQSYLSTWDVQDPAPVAWTSRWGRHLSQDGKYVAKGGACHENRYVLTTIFDMSDLSPEIFSVEQVG